MLSPVRDEIPAASAIKQLNVPKHSVPMLPGAPVPKKSKL